jgi:hypothetical protein
MRLLEFSLSLRTTSQLDGKPEEHADTIPARATKNNTRIIMLRHLCLGASYRKTSFLTKHPFSPSC